MYEITFILNKTVDYKSRIGLCASLAKIILEDKGVLTDLEYLGIQSIYLNRQVIQHQEKGKYVVIKANMNSITLSKLKGFLDQKDTVLRYLILRK